MLNKVCLMGRLVNEPELKQTQSGKAVCSFALAVNREFNRKETDFIDIVAWEKTAEFVSKWFHKGQLVVVCGRIQARNWEDKSGAKRKAIEVVSENVYFAESKKEAPSKMDSTDEEFHVIEDGGDLPF